MIECLLTIVRRYRSTFRNLPINLLPMDNILRIISFLAPPPVPPLLDTYNFYDMLKPFYPPFLPNPNRFIHPKKVKKIDIATFKSLLSGWNLFDNPRSKDPDMIKLRQAIKLMIQSDRKNRLRVLYWKPIMQKAIQAIGSIYGEKVIPNESDICIIPREIATSIQGAEKFIRGPEYIEIYDKVDRVKRYMRTKGYKYYVVYNESQDRYHVIKIVEEYDGNGFSNGFTTTLFTSFDMMTQDEKKKVEDKIKYLMLERLRKRRTEELQSKLKQANAQYALQPPPKIGAGQDHDDQQDDMDQLLASLSPTSRGKLMDTIGRSRLQAQLRQLQKHKSAFVQAFTATARERLNTVQALQEIPFNDYSEVLGVAIAFRANDYTYRLLIYNPLEEMWESPDWGILERWWTDTPQFKD